MIEPQRCHKHEKVRVKKWIEGVHEERAERAESLTSQHNNEEKRHDKPIPKLSEVKWSEGKRVEEKRAVKKRRREEEKGKKISEEESELIKV